MEQNTKEWQQWRHKGIGASDAPVIMGTSPYKTYKQLVEEKRAPEPPPDEDNFIFQKGHKLETKARAQFELLYGMRMEPTLMTLEAWDIARLSFDGYSKEDNEGIECKYVGKDAFIYMEANKKIPDTHIHFDDQIQHQYLVSGAKQIYLCCKTDHTSKLLVLPIKPNKDRMLEIYEKELEFWKLVNSTDEAPMSADDVCEVKDKKLQRMMKTYANLDVKAKAAAAKLDAKKQEILKFLEEYPAIDHDRLEFGALKITKTEGRKSIGWSAAFEKLSEVAGMTIELEPFTKIGASSRTFKVNQKLLDSQKKSKDSDNP